MPRTSSNRCRPLRVLSLLLAAATLGGCMYRCETSVDVPASPWMARRAVAATAVELSPYASCEDLAQSLAVAMAPAAPAIPEDSEAEMGWCWGIESDDDLALPGGQAMAENTAIRGDVAEAEGDRFGVRTGVNQQEESVDEADILQVSDGGRVYIAHAGELRVFRAVPATEASELGRLALPAPALELYLGAATDSVLAIAGRGSVWPLQLVSPGWPGAVFGEPIAVDRGGDTFSDPSVVEGDADMPEVEVGAGHGSSAETRVVLVDFSAPASGVVRLDFRLDGEYLTSRRLADGRLLVVTRFQPPAVTAIAGDPTILELAAAVQAGQAGLDDLRDRLAARLAAAGRDGLTPFGGSDDSAEPLACEALLHPEGAPPALFTAVWFVDVAAGEVTQTVVQSGMHVYVSPENLWLVQSGETWWLDETRAAGSALWRVPLDAEAPGVAAAGLVEGWIPGRMHLGEYEGALRVFSHDGYATRLTIVDATSADELPVLGEVLDIAPGEQLYGVRFLGPRAFAVTFRQTDPLFAFDVADPRAPRLVGALEVPGFSTYLHPVGDDHLVTVGYAGDEFGLTGGLQVQLFDVADLATPRRVDSLEPSVAWSWSEALDEPRAFTFDPRSGILVLPVVGEGFGGFGVYAVDVTHGIRELGLVEHDNFAVPRRARIVEEGGLLELISLSSSALVWSDLGDLTSAPLAVLPLD